ncbi:MAG: ParB/RepB/Spo0J family partition protein [Candidatus Saccharimonadales bacterium]
MAKKGLGRSFESLIPTDLFDDSFDPTASEDQKLSEYRVLNTNDIIADENQPRRMFDEAGLAELTESIKRHGVLQPIVVTPKASKYVIVAGERRYRASKAAGTTTIPALVRTLNDQHKLELALIENLHRRDLNAIETATAYAKLRDQFNLTLEDIGVTVGGRSISAISNTLRLLKLPKAVQEAVVKGEITEGQARPLIGSDGELIASLLPKILKENWSARKIEQTIKAYKQNKPADHTSTRPDYTEAATKLTIKLGATVRITTTKYGSGQVVIRFKDEAELERLKQTLL